MYYEEKVINGILHWRGTPQEEWKAKTPEQLTELIGRLQKENQDLRMHRIFAEEAVEAVEAMGRALKCTKT